MSAFTEALIHLATAELGVSEVNHTNCGPRVNTYKAATDLPSDQSWPWCAAFICWLVREAMQATGIPETPGFKRPRTASAFDFINWSLAQDDTTRTIRNLSFAETILPGDIIVFQFSHIGLATGPLDGSTFPTIEGNTDGGGSREGGAVMRKLRRADQVRAIIRFRI